jgi:RNA polymerase sigma-70 factor (ECF subfamily)
MQLSPHKSYCEHDGLTRLHTCRYTFLLVRVSPYLRESEQFNVHHWEVITENRGSVTTTTFAQVIRQARSHDEEALVALYQRALPVIYRYALARLGRSDLVEDVVSEVFLVMVESIGELRTEQEAGFYAWLLQIAQGKISRALRHVTRNERRHIPLPGTQTSDQYAAVELMATDLASNPVELHEWRETLEELGLALGSLSAEQQVIVIGRFLAGQKIEDLAQALGKQPGAVRVLQFRALNALAKHLGLARGSWRNGKGERA